MLTLVYGFILGSFHPKHQVCALFRFNTQTPDHYSLLGWELFRLRSVTGEEDLFFVRQGRNLFSSFAPKLKGEQQRDFLQKLGRLSDSVFFPLSSNIQDLLFEVVHKCCFLSLEVILFMQEGKLDIPVEHYNAS